MLQLFETKRKFGEGRHEGVDKCVAPDGTFSVSDRKKDSYHIRGVASSSIKIVPDFA